MKSQLTKLDAILVLLTGGAIIAIASPNRITAAAALLTWSLCCAIAYAGYRLRELDRSPGAFLRGQYLPKLEKELQEQVMLRTARQLYRAALRNHFNSLPCDCHPALLSNDDGYHESGCGVSWGPKAAAMLDDPPPPTEGESDLDFLSRACERKIYPVGEVK
jgi:hypothetical protein